MNQTHILGIISVCALGIVIELSKPNSLIGWGLRNKLYKEDAAYWKGGTLVVTPNDVDVMIRTVIGEAALEDDVGKIAVAHVILNRARANLPWYGGKNVADVALHKTVRYLGNNRKITTWQFEPWMSRKDYLWSISSKSELYRKTENIVKMCIKGVYDDPTDGATHFLNPEIVKSRTGGKLPKWASANGVRIGRHVFYRYS
jgi:hypothetical protein